MAIFPLTKSTFPCRYGGAPACFLMLTALVGCAINVDDFRAMSERDQIGVVCDEEPTVSSLADDLSEYREKLEEVEAALTDGYREHVECREVVVGVDCRDYVENASVVRRCANKFQTRCHTVMIPIIYQSELARKNMLREKADSLEIEHGAAYRACSTRVKNMTVAERYRLYEEYYW